MALEIKTFMTRNFIVLFNLGSRPLPATKLQSLISRWSPFLGWIKLGKDGASMGCLSVGYGGLLQGCNEEWFCGYLWEA
ncbi:hypothetical protein A2U01_0012613 [Trifolium medium]|uniref:Uncharacterized protein n=1 Tax=Trifolium medium TaxID=97028 RepID=A0A392MZK3_9FABA|nr:hypothetical protein [Trifolium medium]